MKLAYVDSSCLVAVVFDEPGALELAARLKSFDRLFSSNLLEAELRSALSREGVGQDPGPLLSWISWIFPNRALTAELQRVLAIGYLRGADLWHLACALFLSPETDQMSFVTLDQQQKQVATQLGFLVE